MRALGVYERHFAQAQLQHYLTHTGGDQTIAMELYRWNVAISGAFWQSLAYFEVALRNALDDRMSVRHAAQGRSGHWVFDDAGELGRDANDPRRHRQPYKDIAEAIQRVRRNQKPMSAGQIISEVSLPATSGRRHHLSRSIDHRRNPRLTQRPREKAQCSIIRDASTKVDAGSVGKGSLSGS